jgi:poly-gamma-glutamate synthesis protein (capsule biosynthesis protein)
VASSGVPSEWAAGTGRAGVSILPDLSLRYVDALARRVERVRQAGDLVVYSIHWGANWGFRITEKERAFAHGLIERAGVDLVHGHSSHHVKGIEVFRDRLALYGCGDFVNDYEGIGGHEEFRPELSLMYFPTLEVPGGKLVRLAMVPMRMRRMRIEDAGSEGRHWLARLLRREGEALGTGAATAADGSLELWWK